MDDTKRFRPFLSVDWQAFSGAQEFAWRSGAPGADDRLPLVWEGEHEGSPLAVVVAGNGVMAHYAERSGLLELPNNRPLAVAVGRLVLEGLEARWIDDVCESLGFIEIG